MREGEEAEGRAGGAAHRRTVEAEFTRQAETFRASATLAAPELVDVVAEALGADVGRTLDLACGPGLLLPALAARSRCTVGVDLTPRNLALARETAAGGRVQLVRADAELPPFAAGSFDAAVLRLALHHFASSATALAAVRPLLSARGRLLVLDVLGPEDAATAALRDALERLRDPSHTALLSRSRMRWELACAGFVLREERVWSQPRGFTEWARIVNEPRRTSDLEVVLRALSRAPGDPSGLSLREEGGELWFTYDWGLFVAEVA